MAYNATHESGGFHDDDVELTGAMNLLALVLYMLKHIKGIELWKRKSGCRIFTRQYLTENVGSDQRYKIQNTRCRILHAMPKHQPGVY